MNSLDMVNFCFLGMQSGLTQPPPSPIASLLSLARSEAFPGGFPGEASL